MFRHSLVQALGQSQLQEHTLAFKHGAVVAVVVVVLNLVAITRRAVVAVVTAKKLFC
jgi:type III secretory pathway component EscS